MPTAYHAKGRLNYRTFGSPDNPAIILSNSLGTDFTMWQPQIDAWQNDFYLIAYDTRGHGLSAPVSAPCRLDDLGSDVLAILDTVGIGKAHFCGISMGGLTGLWLGIHAADRLNKLVVCNTAAKIGQTESWLARADSVRRKGLSDIALTAGQRWFTKDFVRQNPATVNRLVSHLADSSPAGYAACCEALAYADLREQIHRIQVPTLSVGGLYDQVTTAETARSLHTAIPNSRLLLLEAAHISNIEAAAVFNSKIKHFLKCH
ncbi:3-oxoadipate enol-lactonase [Neisseria leonii]|uniref:3-oxoadipate enol-lactonase n=1 Tax=Neisseria leonii TaxID=2995413 RepID=UPI00237C30CF|nr:3-oxoadipate enol-lactonase [Neisseria sp. 3986]MDD9325052.1 3-oxoadipate enol-lactonase [Neisseria sp. 3986]